PRGTSARSRPTGARAPAPPPLPPPPARPSRRRRTTGSRPVRPGRRTRTAPAPRRAPAAGSSSRGRDGGPRAGPSCGTPLDAGEGGAEFAQFDLSPAGVVRHVVRDPRFHVLGRL